MKIDLYIAAAVALFALVGLFSGAINQLRHWAGLILAALAARPLATRLTPFAAPKLDVPPAVANVALSAALFIVLYLLGMLAARALLLKLFPGRREGGADRAIGFALGAAKGSALSFGLLSLLIFFEKPLTKAFGAPPAMAGESRLVGFARRQDLFHAVNVPALAGAEKLIEAANNPGGLKDLQNEPELRGLLADPQLKAALQDGELSRALKSGDLSSLQNDPRLKALLNDPRLQSLSNAAH